MRLIDADGFVLDYCHACDGWCEDPECDCLNCKRDECRCDFMVELANAPTVDAEPVRHGRWFHSFGGWLCSECEDQAPFWCMASTQNLSKFCPNCGAKMDGGADDGK